MKLEITKEKVLAAAAKCSTAKATLVTLFPEVFEEDKYLDLSGAETSNEFDIPTIKFLDTKIAVRAVGKFQEKGFWISGRFKWEVLEDDLGELVLVPTKK